VSGSEELGGHWMKLEFDPIADADGRIIGIEILSNSKRAMQPLKDAA
jgi:hypothetical protein